MGVFTFIDSFENKTLFTYLAIMIIILAIFTRLSVQLNVILGLFIGVVVILYMSEKQTLSNELFEKQMDIKLNTIKPVPYTLKDNKNPDLIDFLFSVQDFYVYNQLAYEEMIDNIESFLKLYDDIFNGDEKLVFYYYQIAESKKNNALNSLHSILYKLPVDPIITDKYDRAHKRLETILNKYMNQLYDKCSHILFKNGHNIHTRHINKGPREANHYFDKEFGYQFY